MALHDFYNSHLSFHLWSCVLHVPFQNYIFCVIRLRDIELNIDCKYFEGVIPVAEQSQRSVWGTFVGNGRSEVLRRITS